MMAQCSASEEGCQGPTPFRISTITATGSVNTEIDLDVFYDNLTVVRNDEVDVSGIIYAEYGRKKLETVFKGVSKKTRNSTKKTTSKHPAVVNYGLLGAASVLSTSSTKRFDNQVTIVYRLVDVAVKTPKNSLNIKIFKNGNIQITGIKYIEQGHHMIDIIIDILRGMHAQGLTNIVLDESKLKNVDYTIRLINSDFKIGFPVKRENLYKVFIHNYEHDCCFEPCIYPGVKIRYFYNENNFRQDGVCHCSSPCEVGKGCGRGDGHCKKITIAVFQSGCVIITGAQSHDQINEAYAFIVRVLLDHQAIIEKQLQHMNATPESSDSVLVAKKHMINKKSIVYPDWWQHS